MAITGRFEADFSKFVQACDDAVLKLRDFESGAGKVGASLNKMGDQFSGVKIIQDANLLTKAINEMGGAATLTAKEQAKVNAAVTEAIEKYGKLGQTAPPAMIALADATKKVEAPTENLNSLFNTVGATLKSMAGLVGIAFSAQAVVSFVGRVVDAAGAINDTSAKLGISAEAVQGFKAAADLAGSSLDTVGNAINKMNVNLAEGDKGTVQALKNAGLSFAAIRDMRPEDAFLAITDAIQTIADPMQQAQVATALFGKAGAELLPAIKDGFRGVSDAADKMSNDTISRLDEAGDAWTTFGNQITIVTGGMLADFLKLGEGLNKLARTWEGIKSLAAGAAFGGLTGAMNAVIDTQEKLDNKTKGLIKSYLDVGVSVEDVRKQLHLTSGQISEYVATSDMAKKSTEAWRHETHLTQDEQMEAARAAQKHAEALKEITAAQTPLNAVQRLGVEYLLKLGVGHETIATQIGIHRIQVDQLANSMKAWEDIEKRMPGVVDGLAESFDKLGTKVKVEFPVLKDWSGAITTIDGLGAAWGHVGEQVKPVPPAVKKVTDNLNELSQSLAQLAQISDGAFGGIVRDLATVVASMNVAKKAGKEMKDGLTEGGTEGFTKFASGALAAAAAIGQVTAAGNTASRTIKGAFSGAEAGAAFGPWGAAIGAAIGGVTGLIRGMFGTAGRDSVKAFASSFGGFDALHVKLGELGAAGEQLWIKLTQGVGRNNPEQAKKVIEDINAALAGQDAWMGRLPGLIDKYGLSWEEAGQKFKQAHLDEIAQGLIQDFADLSKAGFDVTLITEKMSDAITNYYQLSKKTSTEIPIAMKPLLQKMVDLGTLTDEAGNKIENLDDVKWAMTLTDGFKGVIDAIHDLTDALTKGVGGALDDLSKRRVTIPIGWNVERRPDTGTGDEASRAATGGMVGMGRIIPFTRGGFVPKGTDTVPAMLTPGELVLNKKQQAALLGGGGTKGSTVVNLTVNIDRPILKDRQSIRELTLEIAKVLPNVLEEHGAA